MIEKSFDKTFIRHRERYFKRNSSAIYGRENSPSV